MHWMALSSRLAVKHLPTTSRKKFMRPYTDTGSSEPDVLFGPSPDADHRQQTGLLEQDPRRVDPRLVDPRKEFVDGEDRLAQLLSLACFSGLRTNLGRYQDFAPGLGDRFDR